MDTRGKPSTRTETLVVLLVPCWLCLIAGAYAADTAPTSNFLDLSIEELMNVKITTVSRKEDRLFETPASAYVITAEDLRRSGATSIPEALRMVPGVQVGRINAHTWAISIRGFNDHFACKLLVMIDGRTVYTPLTAGVYWDMEEVLLEDVERIEVVRGPGGSLWGANAVNGIINIITKNAGETQGLLVQGGAGTEDRAFGAVRYGAKAGQNLLDDSHPEAGSPVHQVTEAPRAFYTSLTFRF